MPFKNSNALLSVKIIFIHFNIAILFNISTNLLIGDDICKYSEYVYDKNFTLTSVNGAYNDANNSAWSTTSDQRIKKNITNNTTGLDKINQITVRNFEYKTEDEIKTDNAELTDVVKHAVVNKEGTQVGSIAQEIESILPDVVRTNEFGIKSVDTSNITWYMVNAIKELSTKVTALETENTALKARVTTLEGG